MEISKVLIATIIVATLSSDTLSAPLSSTPSTLQVLVTYVIPEKTTNATQEVGISVRLYFCRWSHSLSKNHLRKLPHLHRPPETAHGELRSLSPFMTSLVSTTCAAQTNVLLQSIPEWDFFSNSWKKFKNFHFQIRNSVQFLYWKRRFHDLVIWLFKSLTLCFCLNCNQKTALAYVSKGVRFLKKSPGTNGLS